MIINGWDFDPRYTELVDTLYEKVLEANLEKPYSPTNYDRARKLYLAAVTLWAKGDLDTERLIDDCKLNSAEPVMYYVNRFTYVEMESHFG